jgi:hypothetical protein
VLSINANQVNSWVNSCGREDVYAELLEKGCDREVATESTNTEEETTEEVKN